MKQHFKVRVFSLLSILSMLLSAVGIPTGVAYADLAGTALQFNGTTQYVTFGSSTGMETGLGVQTFTIEAWIKKTGSGQTTTTGTGGLVAVPLVTKGRGEGDNSNFDMNYFLGIDTTGVLAADFEECARAQVGCPATTSNAVQGGQNYPAKASTVLQNNIWYHVAVTYDGRYWKFYLNGVQDGVATDTGAARYPRWDSVQHAGLGTAMTSTGGAAGYFQGVIDEARIWNVARSQAEIQADMYNQLTGGTGLIGRWGLNEGSGTTASNSIVGRPNGALTNGHTWVAGFPDATPPAVPTALAATAGNKSVALTWAANSDTDPTGYNLYRSTTTGGPYTKVNTALIATTLYTDSNLTNGVPYYYVLRAVDTSNNESGNSGETSATPEETTTALQFTTASGTYVTFGDPAKLDLAAFTIETWFKRTGTGTPNTTGTGGIESAIPLVTHGSPEADKSNVDANWMLVINDATDVIAADFEDMATGLNHPVYGVTPITNNTWHHAAATYDGTTWNLYLDGNLETTLVVGSFVPRSDSIQRVGLGTMIRSGGTANGFFEGVLDEARVWNVARTQAQIREDINSQLTSGTGLVARWGLNDGVGTVVADSIAPVANGTIIGANYAWVSGAPFNLDLIPPSAPANVSATPGLDSVELSWTANGESDLAGYNVYRSTTSPVTIGTRLNSSLLTSPAYTDSTAIHGATYYYVVTAVDTSNNRSDASLEVYATPLAPPEGAYALQFDGTNDYVTFGAAPNLGVTNFTVETWFYWTGGGIPTTTSTTQGLPSVIPLVTKGRGEADGDNRDMNFFLGIDTTTNTLAADFEDMADGMNHPVSATTPITPNTWHHAAVTYDSVNAVWKLYLDGNLDRTFDIGSNFLPRSDSIQHAGLATAMTSTGTAAGFFQGVIDEVRVWNYVRTQPQILSTINAQMSAPQTGLVARWGLNEGGGTAIASSVGTFPGTLTNGPVWVTPGAPFNIVIDTTPPAAPTNLMSSPRPGAVLLEWTAGTEPDLAGYHIYRSTTSPVTIGTPINGTVVAPSIIDATVTAGITYYYAVTAVDMFGNESALSNETSAVPLPPPPAEALALGSSNAYVTLGDNADSAQFTLETWLRRDGTGTAISTGTGGQTLIPLITNGTAEAETANADINYFFGIRESDGVLCADFEEAQSGATPGQNHPVCAGTPLQTGTWYHAAATYDGTTWRLYLNGNLDGQLSVGRPANAANTSQLAFGTSLTTANAPSGYFNGTLDEVRIWNYARTQTEIAQTINAQITTPQSGLIGRWGLDEASGSVANDTSGNNITGTVIGSGYSWVPGSPFNVVVNLVPPAPQLVEPANAATDVPVPATLTVNVSDPEGAPLDVTFYGRPLQVSAGPDFTLVVIPDTQYYASTYPSIYNAQMQWVVNHKTTDNIVFVASLGDNVDVASNLTQWGNADAAYDILDAGTVSYGLGLGNHDGAPSNTGNYNTYFGSTRFSGQPTYGGHYGTDNDNHYALINASGLKFIVVFLEYDDTMTTADHPVLQWANGLLQSNSDRRAIVISHNVLQGGTSAAFTTQGQTIYNALRANPNLFLIMGGHLDVASRRTDVYNGNTVYTLRSDYQSVDSQQSGYLRVLRFSPAADMIYVTTYSPTQNKLYDKSDAAQNNFNLAYTMDGSGYEMIGTVQDVASGTAATINWSNLDPKQEYEWYAIASDGTYQTQSDIWRFTTPGLADTSVTDFNGGTAGSCVVDASVGDGALRLELPASGSCAFTSRVFDVQRPADWLNLVWRGSAPSGTTVGIETRTGYTPNPNDGSWSAWQAVNSPIASPDGQYIQYRATLGTNNPAITPVVERVGISYSHPAINFGHLPANYAGMNLYANGGAWHLTGPTFLGSLVTSATDGIDTSQYTPKDSDDGITWTPDWAWSYGGQGKVEATVTCAVPPCYVNAWLDWNRDGDFNDPLEQILNQAPITGAGNTTTTLAFPIPESGGDVTLDGSTFFSRFRVYSGLPSNPQPSGRAVATDGFTLLAGEIEDPFFQIVNGSAPTPVTLSFFQARSLGASVYFDWSTGTETGNLGFNLYVDQAGTLTRLNQQLIPSKMVDSLTQQDYTFLAPVQGTTFYVEEVSVLTTTRRHGPFQLGEAYGTRLAADPIDWSAIRSELESGQVSRQSALVPELEAAIGAPVMLNLKVRQTGIHRVSFEMLKAAGLDLTGVAANRIQLINQGKAVPMYVKSTARFGPGSYIEFLGKALDTVYTDTNIYTIKVIATSAARIKSVALTPARGAVPPASFAETLMVNNQRAYASFYAMEDGWYDTSMLVYTTPKTWDFPFSVNSLADPSGSASLELVVWGVTDWPENPDHHLVVSVNGVQLASEAFDGLVVKTIRVNLPPGTLHAGTNTLQLTLPGDSGAKYDMINLDKFSITYQRTFQAENGRLIFTAAGKVFKVTNLPSRNVTVYRFDGSNLVRLSTVQIKATGSTFSATFAGVAQPATYFVATAPALYAPAFEAARAPIDLNLPAQYLIISHPSFIAGLQPLVQARQAQGLTVRVVDVNDLYAQFSYGVFDPQAIKQYITYARQNLGTQYVLLVGGDTYDYRNYLGLNSISLVPSLYADTGTARLVPVDPLFADGNGDNVPDLPIGRFPARTAAELDLMVAKTLAYAAKDYPRTATFASDAYDGYVNFKAISQGFAASMPANWTVETINLDDLPVANAQAQLIAAMNRGTSLVTYTGHSGPVSWTFSGLFNKQHAAALTNAGRPFVVVQWGCWNIYHIDPLNNNLVQALLFSGDKGAAAVLGSSTLTESESEDLLGQRLTSRLVTPGMTIGDALQQAKADLAQTNPELLDVLLGWSLMGDPALVIEP